MRRRLLLCLTAAAVMAIASAAFTGVEAASGAKVPAFNVVVLAGAVIAWASTTVHWAWRAARFEHEVSVILEFLTLVAPPAD